MPRSSTAETDEHEGHLEYDLGNLLVEDPSPLDHASMASEGEAACQSLATRMFQSLLRRLFGLPSETVPQGRVVELPHPRSALPREKPLPTPRPKTKWEEFAERKGIVKRKRSSLVLDENTDEYKRRHGYKRANDASDVPIIEASAADLPGEDPFQRLKREKKQRVAKNQKQQEANLKAAAKQGRHALPPTVRLAATLRDDGKRGPTERRKDAKDDLKAASRQAAVSTASLGKFDKVLRGENMSNRKLASSRKKAFNVSAKSRDEFDHQSKIVDHIVRKNADDIVDMGKAIGQFEAGAREERHAMKMKGANKKGRLSNPQGVSKKKGGSGGGKRGPPAGGKRGPPSGGNKGKKGR
ncbi:ribosome biogenesis regulatory protein [Helicosporidium sp. ATCC 50920]|nr:ribosome biogenesis regulatory protein [Helicosporidium sp. ATCC 50920]|eukprot:KDD76151.1 ribosome biogenesis regulatory protein [Helicosporidium sp. ATCC 50920]